MTKELFEQADQLPGPRMNGKKKSSSDKLARVPLRGETGDL